MVRKAIVLTLALTLPVGAGCVVHASGEAKTGSGEEAPPPPPPPPPPAEEPKAEAPKEPPKAATAEKVEVDKKGKISIPGNIVFDTGKATLKEGAGSEVVLDQLKAYLDGNPRVTKIRVEGHTDNVGNDDANLKLSGERALTIKRWLIDKGEKPERIIAAGFGETRPIADNATEAGKAQNRRTEFHIAELDGKPYLGMDPTRGGTVFE